LCRAIADRIQANAESIAQLITAESAKPLRFARAEVARAVSTFTLAAAEALRFPNGEILPLDVIASGEGYHGHFVRVPAGPVLGICPFNFPLNLVAHKVAPALAVGCPVVIKPAPQAPLTALYLGSFFLDAARETGSDPRLLQVAPLSVQTAQYLAESPAFALLSFTGSAAVGWHLKSTCGQKRITLELGGNAPAIVHSDADLHHAVTRCTLGAFASAGQVCIKVQRILVHRPIYADFRTALLDRAATVAVGDPADPNTIVGPVIDARSADRITTWVDEAIAEGASSLLLRRREGNTIWPVILEHVPPQSRIACEEVFGPVVTLEPYDTFDQAIALANSSPYGLQAGVFTSSLQLAHQAATDLEFGGVIINDVPMFRVDNFPYGGVKSSGLGREGVRYAMEDMTELRMIAHCTLSSR
jgi:glyceraldehyde-3-phosphate dehydrogenase (NADP+)